MTSALKLSIASVFMMATVQPPKPAPVMRAPITPGWAWVSSTRASSSGQLTS
ncbi:hypothetical protein D3C72_2283080 [compost metagenome]